MKSMCILCPNKEPFKLKPIHSGFSGVCPRCGWEKIVIIPNYKNERKNK